MIRGLEVIYGKMLVLTILAAMLPQNKRRHPETESNAIRNGIVVHATDPCTCIWPHVFPFAEINISNFFPPEFTFFNPKGY